MDKQSFHALAEEHMDMVYRVAYNSLVSPHDADDVTQEVFLRLLRSKTEFESGEHVKHWLLRVTINECRRLTRSPWRRHTVPLDSFEGTLQLETPEQSDLFRQVMALPKKYRVPLYLFYYEELSTEEIARIINRSPSTVRTQLYRARQQLKDTLEEEWSNE